MTDPPGHTWTLTAEHRPDPYRLVEWIAESGDLVRGYAQHNIWLLPGFLPTEKKYHKTPLKWRYAKGLKP